jgi:hypothetical protein
MSFNVAEENINRDGRKRELFLKKTFGGNEASRSIFPRMFVLDALFVRTGIDYNNHEDHEAQSQENNDPGPVFPDLLNATRKLGPIHVVAPYTPGEKK